jgi:hypothetical protein
MHGAVLPLPHTSSCHGDWLVMHKEQLYVGLIAYNYKPLLILTILVKVKVTLRLTATGVESPSGLMTRYLLLFDSYDLDFVGRPL